MSETTQARRFDRRHLIGAGIGAGLVAATALGPRIAGGGDPVEVLTIRVSCSTEKVELLRELANEYNESGRDVDGRRGRFTVKGLTSGAMKIRLSKGNESPPDVWLPTSSMWLRLLEVDEDAPELFAQARSPSSVTASTLVIAMPQPVAEALEEHGAPLDTWADVLALAQSGWSAYDKPEWGPFALARDNADSSTSGLAATVATYVAAPGGRLTRERLKDPEVVSFVHGIESSVPESKYGDEAVRFMEQIYEFEQERADDPAYRPYIDAIVIQEQMVYLYNRSAPGGDPDDFEDEPPTNPLRVVHPEDGTLELDHPFIVLTENADNRALAADFYRFLVEDEQQRRFTDLGFRSLRDPARPTEQLVRYLELPEDQRLKFVETPGGELVEAMLKRWSQVRHQARVLLLLDVSGSMGRPVNNPLVADDPTKLDLLKPAAQKALDLLDDDDEIGLWTFSSNPDHTEVMPVSRVGDVRDALKAEIRQLEAREETTTALYAAIDNANQMMVRTADPDRLNAIVVLSDGQNTEGYKGRKSALLEKLNPEHRETVIGIFTIPFGDDADIDTLSEIAKITKAAQYDARDPLDVGEAFVRVFRDIGG